MSGQAAKRVAPLAKGNVLRSIVLAFLLALVAPIGLSACGGGGSGGGSSTPPTPVTPAPPASPIVAGQALPQAGTIYLGGFINPSGLAYGNTPPYVAAFETQIGRKLALDLQFATFTTKFGGRSEQDDYANGRIPIYSWDCGATNLQVATGVVDASLRLQADAIRTYGWPVFVRYLWDMNLPAANFNRSGCYDPATDLPDNYFSAPNFIAAWTHIRQIFAQEGATNAVWLWTVSGVGSDSMAYYPGDAQVDWVGFDQYDLSATDFASTLEPMYALLAPLKKPIMVSSTGAGQIIQTSFFASAATTLQTQFPNVKAFVYYDGIGIQDWRLTPASTPAFATFANSPYLAAHYVH